MIYDAIVIGGGPAGCSCALWLHLLDLKVLLIEQKSHLGGLQAESPYPNPWIAGVRNVTGIEFAQQLEEQIRELKVPLRLENSPQKISLEKDLFTLVTKSGEEFVTKNIVMATGVVPRSGEFISADHVLIGPGHQIENYDFTNQRVAIFGGGDNAAENYSFILKAAPAKLHIFARKWIARDQLSHDIPKTAMTIEDYRVDQKTMTVHTQAASDPFDVFVVFYGWEASIPEALKPFHLSYHPKGFVMTDAFRKTSHQGIWAIGEVTQQVYPCVATSISDGVICAMAILKDK